MTLADPAKAPKATFEIEGCEYFPGSQMGGAGFRLGCAARAPAARPMLTLLLRAGAIGDLRGLIESGRDYDVHVEEVEPGRVAGSIALRDARFCSWNAKPDMATGLTRVIFVADGPSTRFGGRLTA
ncbi:hypothetical protein [Acidisoma sp. C75]